MRGKTQSFKQFQTNTGVDAPAASPAGEILRGIIVVAVRTADAETEEGHHVGHVEEVPVQDAFPAGLEEFELPERGQFLVVVPALPAREEQLDADVEPFVEESPPTSMR